MDRFDAIRGAIGVYETKGWCTKHWALDANGHGCLPRSPNAEAFCLAGVLAKVCTDQTGPLARVFDAAVREITETCRLYESNLQTKSGEEVVVVPQSMSEWNDEWCRGKDEAVHILHLAAEREGE